MIEISSQQYQVFGVGDSLQGGRSENQDDFSFTHTPLGFLVVLCDGMGGGPGGKTASYLAMSAFMQALASCNSSASPNAALRMAVNAAEEALEFKMNEDPSLIGMGSTLASVLFSEQTAYVVHLGDSRVYQLRGDKMVFRTKDHSLVQELRDRKALTEEQARTSPQSNVIMRGLGNTTNHVPEIEEVKYKRGDRFVICSDGVWASMPSADMLDRLTRQAPPSLIVSQLQQEVDHIGFASGGSHDNHTLIMLEVKGKVAVKSIHNLWDISPRALGIAILAVLLLLSLVFNVVLTAKIIKGSEVSDLNIERWTEEYASIESMKDKNYAQSVLVGILSRHNDSLYLENMRLRLLADSLQDVLGGVDNSTQSSTKTIPEQILVHQNVAPIILLDSSLILLTKMQRKYEEKEDVLQLDNQNRFETIIKMLRQFALATTPQYDQKIENLIRDFQDKKDLILGTRFRKEDKKYTASLDACMAIDGYKKTVESIIDKYKIRDHGNDDITK